MGHGPPQGAQVYRDDALTDVWITVEHGQLTLGDALIPEPLNRPCDYLRCSRPYDLGYFAVAPTPFGWHLDRGLHDRASCAST